jgi:hypothetical protein
MTQSGHHQVTQFRAAPYRLRTATHRLPISSCGAAAKVAPHFHKAAAPTSWGRSHSRIAAYLHGIRSFRVFFRSNAVAVSPLVMHISATTVNNRIMRLPVFAGPPRCAASTSLVFQSRRASASWHLAIMPSALPNVCFGGKRIDTRIKAGVLPRMLRSMSAFGGKADMTFCGANVCFDPKRTPASSAIDAFATMFRVPVGTQ